MIIVPTLVRKKRGRIFGILFKPSITPKKTPIIITHGSGDSSSQYPLVDISKILTKKRYITFRFDFRGCGNSDGKQENYSISSQIDDIASVINFVKKKTKAKKVGIISKSISSVPAFILASKRNDVKYIVALGAPYDIEKYWKKDELKMVKRKGYIFFKGFRYGRKYAEEMRKFKRAYVDSLKKVNIPVLLLVGEKDEKVSIEEENKIFSLLKSKKKYIRIIKDSDHSFKLKEDSLKHLIRYILLFLQQIRRKGL